MTPAQPSGSILHWAFQIFSFDRNIVIVCKLIRYPEILQDTSTLQIWFRKWMTCSVPGIFLANSAFYPRGGANPRWISVQFRVSQTLIRLTQQKTAIITGPWATWLVRSLASLSKAAPYTFKSKLAEKNVEWKSVFCTFLSGQTNDILDLMNECSACTSSGLGCKMAPRDWECFFPWRISIT